MADSTPQPASAWRRHARNLAPWLVAGLAMFWVTHAVHWGDVWRACEHVPLGWFVGTSLVMLLLNCAADTLAMYYTFGWFGCHVPYRELFIIRGATYLVAVVQYYVGQAAILGFLRQRKGVPLWRGAGWILFVSAINMGVLVLIAAAGLARAPIDIRWLKMVPLAVAITVVCYCILLKIKPPIVMRYQILAPIFEMGISGHIKSTIVRVPHVLVLILWHWLSLRWFGVHVPVITALVYLPAVFFFAALPVSVQGLGLSQWAAVTFFVAYSDTGKPAVLAYSLAMTAVSLVIQVSMGVLFLRSAQRLGMRETPQADDAASPAPVAAG
jgi:hypothetical protein